MCCVQIHLYLRNLILTNCYLASVEMKRLLDQTPQRGIASAHMLSSHTQGPVQVYSQTYNKHCQISVITKNLHLTIQSNSEKIKVQTILLKGSFDFFWHIYICYIKCLCSFHVYSKIHSNIYFGALRTASFQSKMLKKHQQNQEYSTLTVQPSVKREEHFSIGQILLTWNELEV